METPRAMFNAEIGFHAEVAAGDAAADAHEAHEGDFTGGSGSSSG